MIVFAYWFTSITCSLIVCFLMINYSDSKMVKDDNVYNEFVGTIHYVNIYYLFCLHFVVLNGNHGQHAGYE